MISEEKANTKVKEKASCTQGAQALTQHDRGTSDIAKGKFLSACGFVVLYAPQRIVNVSEGHMPPKGYG
jgi:hypothetical protein